MRSGLELWGGIECTVNRVGETYFDQLARSGYHRRGADLDRFAALGIRALRCPVLWESVAPAGLAHANWGWVDEQLGRLRELGLRPIISLIHHGSGPRHTSLVNERFVEQLADFAGAVADRYPWVTDFTPVNEPLTTARFSCLYGHWYPHARSLEAFVAALVIQCRAIARAMRAIRAVTPKAQLIQTEDIGRTFASPALAAQAAYEGHRRWLSLDLLEGRVDQRHPLRDHLETAGASAAELDLLVATPTPPDVIGLNYYVTSDRFIDDDVESYPPWSHGGNGSAAYADVEAFRATACPDDALGWAARLAEVWERYGRPIAITEAHLGGGREEQLRWLWAAWAAASEGRARGMDIRAVTAWSLLGAFDWNRLVTCDADFYEPGVFDVRGASPRATGLARMIRGLALDGSWNHPVLANPGWWERAECRPYGRPSAGASTENATAAPIVITGATGTLGQAFARLCAERGLAFRLLSRADLDIADPASVARGLDAVRPWAVINTAGYVRVDEAEADAVRCFRENATGPEVLAAACAARGIALVTFSSDLVFDGASERPYVESDAPAPLSVYGASKADAERGALAAHPAALVVRTSAFFGPWDRHNFLFGVCAALRERRAIRVPGDSVVSPTYVPDLVHTILDLLVDGERGVWHLANVGAVSWASFARHGAVACGLDVSLVEDCGTASLGFAAKRPGYSVLGSERAVLLPSLDDAIARFAAATRD